MSLKTHYLVKIPQCIELGTLYNSLCRIWIQVHGDFTAFYWGQLRNALPTLVPLFLNENY